LNAHTRPPAWSIVREYVLIGPPGDVEAGPRGQEIEAGAGDFKPSLARQPLLEDRGEAVEVAYVRRGVLALRLAELGGAPVARLLLLGQVEPEQLADQHLEPVAVG